MALIYVNKATPSVDAKEREELEIIARPQRYASPFAHGFDIDDIIGVLKIKAAWLAQFTQSPKDAVIKIPLLDLRAQFDG